MAQALQLILEFHFRMRADPLIIIVILATLIVALYYFSPELEGFETLMEKVTDRTNSLAQVQNPLKNPSAAIGISEAAGASLRTKSQIALNVPSSVVTGGVFTEGPLVDPLSPRIDNANSYLGMIKMCKDKGVGERPFDDPAFAANCGMCVTSGSLKTGETFTKPTGVLVYAADKADFQKDKTANQHIFPRAIPSIDAATCEGASRTDSAKPSLAITQADFDAFRARAACKASHGLGNGCAKCVSTNESSWIPKSGGIQPLTLWLSGAGTAVITVGGQQVGGSAKTITLSETTIQIPLGRVPESTSFNITVSKGTSVDGPYVYGIMTSLTPANKMYKLAIERFLEVDKVSGTFVRKGTPKEIPEIKSFSAKLLPQGDKTSMSLDGFIPLTFVEPDQLAAFDCAASPFVSTQASAELLVNDPCLNPRGQKPGNYSTECLQKAVLNAGCSTNGEWYKSTDTLPKNMTPAQITQTLRDVVARNPNVPVYSKLCSGVDISTPCDNFMNGGTPDKACMAYLYSNDSEFSKRTGRAYNRAGNKFTSAKGKNIQFCQPEGSLNPANPNGMAALQGAAAGYNGLKGIEAVRKFLSDVFTKATGDLDINISDAKGGRKDSWAKCIGAPVADPISEEGFAVSLNSRSDVITNGEICSNMFPSRIDLNGKQGNRIGEIEVTGDYTLSFDVTLRSTNPQWSNIIHFSTTGNNCCSPGDRCPAIWFWPGTSRLHVPIGDMANGNWYIDTNPIPMNQKVNVKLICKGRSVSLVAAGQVINVTQPTARPTGKAIVWASDPWHYAANALIENLCYTPHEPASGTSYRCRALVDHGGDDIQCTWGYSSYVGKMIKAACDANPRCTSYNTIIQGSSHAGCIKHGPTNINSPDGYGGVVREYCVKN